MSVDLFVFLSKPKMLTAAEWQTAIDRLGVDVHLDESIDAAQHSGFWPADCGSRRLGFEYYAGSIADTFGASPPAGLGDRDFVVDFVTHSDLLELRCAMICAAALAIETGGLTLDDGTGELVHGVTLLEQALTIPPPTKSRSAGRSA